LQLSGAYACEHVEGLPDEIVASCGDHVWVVVKKLHRCDIETICDVVLVDSVFVEIKINGHETFLNANPIHGRNVADLSIA
jgi:hypothetical protein